MCRKRRSKIRPTADWVPSNIAVQRCFEEYREVYTVELYGRVRRAVLVDGKSEREAGQRFCAGERDGAQDAALLGAIRLSTAQARSGGPTLN